MRRMLLSAGSEVTGMKWTTEGIVTGSEPYGDIVIGAIMPKQNALTGCYGVTSLLCEGTIFNSNNIQPFSYLKGMKKLVLKNTSGSLSSLAFAYATVCEEVRIIGTYPTSFPSNIFNGLGAGISKSVIYVPWAEGEVANAPWGATNATIHYNTVYDDDGNPITT